MNYFTFMFQDELDKGSIGDVCHSNVQFFLEIHDLRVLEKALGGGVMLDLGVYTVNFTQMVFGDKVKDNWFITILNFASC